MSFQPKILGYFILPYDGSEGFASLSLEELVNSHGSELKFPILNRRRLEKLKSLAGVKRELINNIDSTGNKEKVGWSPTSRFLYQMSENVISDKLGDPANRVIVTASRKVIIEIIRFAQSKNSNALALKSKLKVEKYGRVLKLANGNQVHKDNFWSRKLKNYFFGLKFGLYLTSDDQQNTKKDASLFSIHYFKMNDVYFIYEAEIDALEQVIHEKSGKSNISICEIKTHNNREEIVKAFNEYVECSKLKTYSQDQMESSINKLEDKFLAPKFGLPFRQGELGNVDKFIYGFYDNSTPSHIRGEEFDCFPGTFVTRDASYILQFVQLLNDSGFVSPNYDLTWDEWANWQLKKENNLMKLEKGGPAGSSSQNHTTGDIATTSSGPVPLMSLNFPSAPSGLILNNNDERLGNRIGQ